jgi:DNA repair protein RadA/Sms
MKLGIGNPVINDSTNILDIIVPKEMLKNVQTGISEIDNLCAGDGMTPSTALLLTGLPGTGKSTLGLQFADATVGKGHATLYNTAEESLYQVRKTVTRLALKNGFTPGYDTDVEQLIARANALRNAKHNKGKHFFLIVDSLQTLTVPREEGARGRPMSTQNMAVAAALRLTEWAKETFSIVVMIGQVTKDGVFAGKQEIKHAVDCHLHLSIDKDRKSDTYGERVAEMEKNRFGPSGLFYPFQLGALGLRFKSDEPTV